jgi:hypothetical protein
LLEHAREALRVRHGAAARQEGRRLLAQVGVGWGADAVVSLAPDLAGVGSRKRTSSLKKKAKNF